ncbi:MAG: sulfotransferase domain-containing protein [Saprospiraceae bacterium]
MENILIHIGYHKTGTTWLQHELFKAENFTFQPLSLHNRAGDLARHFIYGADNYLHNPFEDREQEIRKNLAAILTKSSDLAKDKTWVMSYERLSGSPHCGGFDAPIIARRLKKIFPKGKILIVIREQRSFLLSSYFQYLATLGTHSLEQYLNTAYDTKIPNFSPHHVNYLPLIKHYLELFGRENVLVLPYEFFRADKQAFIQRLGDFLNKKIDVSTARFEHYRNVKKYHFTLYHFRWLHLFLGRTSLNNHSILANRFSRTIGRFFQKMLFKFIPKSWNQRTQIKLQTQVNQWVGDRYQANNRELASLLDLDLGQYGYF